MNETRIGQNVVVSAAIPGDLEEILALQKLAFLSEAAIYDDYSIPPLKQTLEEVRTDFEHKIFLKASVGGVIIGSVRGRLDRQTCHIEKLIVHPDFQNCGIGTRLMHAIEAEFKQAERYALGTGNRSERPLYLYHKLGYKIYKFEPSTETLTIVHLEKLQDK